MAGPGNPDVDAPGAVYDDLGDRRCHREGRIARLRRRFAAGKNVGYCGTRSDGVAAIHDKNLPSLQFFLQDPRGPAHVIRTGGGPPGGRLQGENGKDADGGEKDGNDHFDKADAFTIASQIEHGFFL